LETSQLVFGLLLKNGHKLASDESAHHRSHVFSFLPHQWQFQTFKFQKHFERKIHKLSAPTHVFWLGKLNDWNLEKLVSGSKKLGPNDKAKQSAEIVHRFYEGVVQILVSFT
jgi:hypothetical protein